VTTASVCYHDQGLVPPAHALHEDIHGLRVGHDAREELHPLVLHKQSQQLITGTPSHAMHAYGRARPGSTTEQKGRNALVPCP
jgi:hypothetical protein